MKNTGSVLPLVIMVTTVALSEPAKGQTVPTDVASSCFLLTARQLPAGIAGIRLKSAEIVLGSYQSNQSFKFYDVRMTLDLVGKDIIVLRTCAVGVDGSVELMK